MNAIPYEYVRDADPLWPVCKRAFAGRDDIPSFHDFMEIMKKRTGFTICDGEIPVGCILYENIIKGHNANIHCFIDPEYHGRWLNRTILKHVFDYVFNDHDVHRITSIQNDLTNKNAEELILWLGFKTEGIIRQGYKFRDSLYNLKIYGLLKEERRY